VLIAAGQGACRGRTNTGLHTDTQLAAAARTSPTAALLATGRQRRKRWAKLTPSVRSQIIDEIVVVTVNPAPRGRRGFDPDCIDIAWKK
jgi:site-specific DNA recombinase